MLSNINSLPLLPECFLSSLNDMIYIFNIIVDFYVFFCQYVNQNKLKNLWHFCHFWWQWTSLILILYFYFVCMWFPWMLKTNQNKTNKTWSNIFLFYFQKLETNAYYKLFMVSKAIYSVPGVLLLYEWFLEFVARFHSATKKKLELKNGKGKNKSFSH